MIRPANLDDVDALIVLGTRFIEETTYRDVLAVNVDQLRRLAVGLIHDADSVIAVSECDGVIVGMLGLYVKPHFIDGQVFAGEVFWWVEPEFRGEGVKLLRWCERWAREKGAQSIQMIAPNDRVAALYRRLGYRERETTYERAIA